MSTEAERNAAKAAKAEAAHGSRPTRCKALDPETHRCCLREAGHYGAHTTWRLFAATPEPQVTE